MTENDNEDRVFIKANKPEMCKNWNYADKSCVSDGKFSFPYDVVVKREDLEFLINYFMLGKAWNGGKHRKLKLIKEAYGID